VVSQTLSALVALIPAVALASADADENPEIQQAALETWTVEQLCGARTSADALDELERRDVFDRRELRAIRRARVRNDIGEEALRCMKGAPMTTLPAITTFEGDPVDALVYPPGTTSSLIVYMRRAADVSTVVAFTESADPYLFPSFGQNGSCSGNMFLARWRDICTQDTAAYRQHRQMVQAMTPQATIDPVPPQTLPSQ